MARLGLESISVDADVYERALARFREARVVLPTHQPIEFAARSRQSFRDGLLDLVPALDAMIAEFNARSGAAATLRS